MGEAVHTPNSLWGSRTNNYNNAISDSAITFISCLLHAVSILLIEILEIKPGMVAHVYNPSAWEQRQEDLEFKANLITLSQKSRG
jgi:hypothetical protein